MWNYVENPFYRPDYKSRNFIRSYPSLDSAHYDLKWNYGERYLKFLSQKEIGDVRDLYELYISSEEIDVYFLQGNGGIDITSFIEHDKEKNIFNLYCTH